MVPTNFRIEILTIRARLCALGSKGLIRGAQILYFTLLKVL